MIKVLKRPGQTLATFQRNILQHCWVQHVACVWPVHSTYIATSTSCNNDARCCVEMLQAFDQALNLHSLTLLHIYPYQFSYRILRPYCTRQEGMIVKRESTSTSTCSSTRQSPFLAYGCFCLGGLIHRKPF